MTTTTYRTGILTDGTPVIERANWVPSTLVDGGVTLPCSILPGTYWRFTGGTDLWADLTPFMVPPTVDGFGNVTDWGTTNLPADYYAQPIPAGIVHTAALLWYPLHEAWRLLNDPLSPPLVPNPATLIVDPLC